ncbi:MAG: SurA N-terminal domain-containing protein [Pseudomonadota bacterium]|nr:SurA N-terminal domain-containing protein [Pseudomonadota bacterium]
MDGLRNFLTGRRLIFIGIFLAVPFVFFGTNSFGTVFTDFGKVNGLKVTPYDINIAVSNVDRRLEQIYGGEFSRELLGDGVYQGYVRQEIVAQKALLSQAIELGLNYSEDDAKRSIMQNTAFQVDGKFDQEIFQATLRSNGIVPKEFIEAVRNDFIVNQFLMSVGNSSYVLDSEIHQLIELLEQKRNVEFFKIDFQKLKDSSDISLSDAQSYFEENSFVFQTPEKKIFQFIRMDQEDYKSDVEVPENFVNDQYNEYLVQLKQRIERRISHLMLDVSAFNSRQEANLTLQTLKEDIQNGSITFEDAVINNSSDFATVDLGGDLGFSSGESFPAEFELAIQNMQINELSNIVDLGDTLHLLKLTEINEENPLTLEEMEVEFLNELMDQESLALMNDDRDSIEDLILNNYRLEEIALEMNLAIKETPPIDDIDFSSEDFAFNQFLMGLPENADYAEVFETENGFYVASLKTLIEPQQQEFSEVVETVFDMLKTDFANDQLSQLSSSYLEALNGEVDEIILESGVTRESYNSLGRDSSLLPPDIIEGIFDSKKDTAYTAQSSNNDTYILVVDDITLPEISEIEALQSNYAEFVESISLIKLNQVLESEISNNINDKIKNLNI